MEKFIQQVKDLYDGGRSLPVYEMFYTIQGEGFNTGKAVFLIRLSGCDVGCPWCDTKYAWRPKPEQLIEVEKIVQLAKSYPAKSLLVTGGEPTLYNLEPLTLEAKKFGIKTYLETSGTEEITGQWDWICLSPKPFKPVKGQAFELANELKVIIYTESDLLFAEEMSSKVSDEVLLFLQPEWGNRDRLLPLLIDYIKEHPQWRLSLQVHKILGIP